MGTNIETVRERKRTKKLAEEIAQAAIDAIPPERDTELEVDFQAPGEGEPMQMGDPTDVFEAAKSIIDKHDFAKFTIKKNGEYIATKPYPYSIEQLQREYGAGSYLIFLKQGSNGRIVKQQTLQIADSPTQEPKTMPQFAFDSSTGMGMETGSKQPSFMEFFILKNDMEEKNRIRQQEMEAKLEARQREIDARLKEAERAKESSSSEMFKLMLSMQQESAKQLQAVMMESQKSQITLLTSLLSKPKDDGLKAHELAKMLGDAEKNGYARWKDISEMIDKKAEARAEELAAQQSEGDESLTKTIVKGFIPVISQALNSGALSGQPIAAPEQLELQRRQQEYNRVQLENQKLAQRREIEMKKAKEAAKKAAAVKTAQVVKEINDLPAPNTTTKKAPRDTMNGKFKDHIQSLVLPIIAEDYGNRITGAMSAEKCLAHLRVNDISRKDVLDNFKLQDIIKLAETYQLPPETIPWFKEFYSALEAPNGVEVTRNANVETAARTSPGEFAENS